MRHQKKKKFGRNFLSQPREYILKKRKKKKKIENKMLGTRFPPNWNQLSFEEYKLATRQRCSHPYLPAYFHQWRKKSLARSTRDRLSLRICRSRGREDRVALISNTPVVETLNVTTRTIGSPLISVETRPKRNPRRRNTVFPPVCPAIKFPPTTCAVSFSRYFGPSWNFAGSLCI